MGKKNVYFPYWVYTKPFIWKFPYRKGASGKRFESGTTKSTSVPTNKNIASKIPTHISSVLRYLGVIFDKSILSGSPKLAGADHVGTRDSCFGTQNQHRNVHNNEIGG